MQLSFPNIQDEEEVINLFGRINNNSHKAKDLLYESLANMHSVGEFLNSKKLTKADKENDDTDGKVSIDNWTLYLEQKLGAIPKYQLERCAKLAKRYTREEVESIHPNDVHRIIQLELPMAKTKSTKPAVSTTHLHVKDIGMKWAKPIIEAGGIDTLSPIERRQIAGMMKPFFEFLEPLYITDLKNTKESIVTR